MDKPKEFWILPQKGSDCEWTNLYPDASWRSETKPLIHVIEYSAYEQLQKRFDEAVEVIKFYADEDGGPYAAGDYHTADGGEMALNFLRSLDKGER